MRTGRAVPRTRSAGPRPAAAPPTRSTPSSVADRLDIPFYALDFERDFARIMDHFADEYVAGRTPNPCVMCNIWLKFGKLWCLRQAGRGRLRGDRPLRPDRGADRTARRGSRGRVDRRKDQSYVLFGLGRELLPHVLFPVGEFPKAEIRAIAREHGLPVHDKPDSQEICFVPDDDYLGLRPGAAARARHGGPDRRRGRHGPGPSTPGSRRSRSASAAGWGSPSARRVTSCRSSRRLEDRDGRAAASRSRRSGWRPRGSTGKGPARPARSAAWPRSAPSTGPSPRRSSRWPASRARVLFDVPQSAITPGQVVTVYQDDLVLGGGWIDRGLDDAAPAHGARTDQPENARW